MSSKGFAVPRAGRETRFAGPAADSAAVDFPVLAASLLGEGRTVRFTARGRSMRPFIRDGDEVTVAPMDAGGEPRRGDIVLYRASGGRVALHRALRRYGNGGRSGWLCRGDGMIGPEERVPAGALLGRAVAVTRAGRDLPVCGAARRRLGRAWARWQGVRWFGVRLVRLLRGRDRSRG